LFYKNKRSQSKKNTPHVHFFQLLLFFLFQQNVHFSFFRSIAICANPNSKRAALERSFQKKKTSRAHKKKKTGVPAFFNPNFFSVCFLFYKRKEKYNEKN